MQQTKSPNRKIIPINHKVEELLLSNPEHSVMSNGLNLYLIESGLEDVTRVDIIVGAGSSFQQKKLCASFTNSLLKEGTKTLNSKHIAERLDFHGAYLSTSINKDKSVITLFSLTKHLSKLLPMLKSIVTEAKFPQDEFGIHLDRNRQEYLVNSEKARYIATLEFNTLIFGNGSAYGQSLQINDFEDITVEDLKRFYKIQYQPKNSYIIVSGRPDIESKQLLNKLFGEEWLNNDIEIIKPVNIVSGQFIGQKTVKKDKFLQSAIRMGKNVINKFDEDYDKLLFTNTILGGYFGSRLMSNLREDKGMTYGVSSFISNFLHGSYFAIATEVNIDQTKAALKEIKKEINILQNEKTSDDEILLVKNYIYGSFLKNFDGAFALAEMFRSVNDFGLDFDFFNKSLNKIMDITAEDVLVTAQKHLNINDMAVLVVGDVT